MRRSTAGGPWETGPLLQQGTLVRQVSCVRFLPSASRVLRLLGAADRRTRADGRRSAVRVVTLCCRIPRSAHTGVGPVTRGSALARFLGQDVRSNPRWGVTRMALPTGAGPSWDDLVAALVSTRTDHATARFDEVLAAAEAARHDRRSDGAHAALVAARERPRRSTEHIVEVLPATIGRDGRGRRCGSRRPWRRATAPGRAVLPPATQATAVAPAVGDDARSHGPVPDPVDHGPGGPIGTVTSCRPARLPTRPSRRTDPAPASPAPCSPSVRPHLRVTPACPTPACSRRAYGARGQPGRAVDAGSARTGAVTEDR